MKAILEFNLPEEEIQHKEAVNGGKYKCVLIEYDTWLRSQFKYNESLSEESINCYSTARKKLRELFEDELQEEL